MILYFTTIIPGFGIISTVIAADQVKTYSVTLQNLASNMYTSHPDTCCLFRLARLSLGVTSKRFQAPRPVLDFQGHL